MEPYSVVVLSLRTVIVTIVKHCCAHVTQAQTNSAEGW
jgi:hypothetical protein